jgi:hypothetical protein
VAAGVAAAVARAEPDEHAADEGRVQGHTHTTPDLKLNSGVVDRERLHVAMTNDSGVEFNSRVVEVFRFRGS